MIEYRKSKWRMVELSEKYSNTVNNDLDIWGNYSVCSHRHTRANNSYGLKGADNTYELKHWSMAEDKACQVIRSELECIMISHIRRSLYCNTLYFIARKYNSRSDNQDIRNGDDTYSFRIRHNYDSNLGKEENPVH